MKTFLVSMLAVATLASCSKEEVNGGGSTTPVQADKAYLSLAINAAPSTYADSDPIEGNGTEAESKATKVLVVGFKENVEMHTLNIKGVYTLGTAEQGTIGGQGVTTVAGDAFKIDKEINKIFVIINPTAAVEAQVNAATTYAAMNQVIASETIAAMTTNDNFMMTSAGVAADDKGLVSVTPALAANESAEAINAAKAEAKNKSVAVSVDRSMAKVTLNTFAGSVENGTAQIDGWKLNTTNTKYLPYAELVAYTLDGTTAATNAKYRKDANFVDAGAAYSTEFNWLSNSDNIAWNALGNNEYCFENTMEAAAQDYNNSTKMIIKAKFAPKGVTLGNSWFRVDGLVKTFDELKADYAAAKVGGADPNPTIITGYDAFAVAMFGTGKTFDDLTFGDKNATSDIETVANGGYKAAKATTYMIEYFQGSVCYYDVILKHDYRVQAKLLGRWGVVRNNFYLLSVTKISKAGKPYIPDPTDSEISDVENPDHTNPLPDDEVTAYISVTITVNPWTVWSQETEL